MTRAIARRWNGAARSGRRTIALAAALAAAAASPGARAEEVAQKRFSSPEAAAEALAAAIAAQGDAALLAVLGPKAKPIVDSGDPVADQNARERFAKAWAQAHVIEASGDARATLDVGEDRWPFPVPLVKEKEGWRFDTDAGDEEILARRIGRNELSAIQACLAYVDAQREYYQLDPDGDSLLHYAAHFASSPGKRDGLYWEAKPGEPASPLGPLFAEARGEGYAPGTGKGEPLHGYRFRILTSQGPHAPGGAYDYRVGDALFGGFAMVAWPATWGASGVMTFLVSHAGTVYEQDLGPDTEEDVAKITSFDPGEGWTVVDVADEE